MRAAPLLALGAIVLAAAGPAQAQLPTLPEAVQAIEDARTRPAHVDITVHAGRFVATDWSDTLILTSIGPVGLSADQRVPRAVRPYVFAGVGVVAYDLERPIGPEFLARLANQPASAPLFIHDDTTDLLLAVDELSLEATPAVHAGVGVDLRIPLGRAGIGLRLEVADHVSPSPVDLRVIRLDQPGPFLASPQTRVEFDAVHHVRATVGLVIDFR